MTAIRLSGQRGLSTEFVNPGDTLLTTDIFSPVTSAVGATLGASSLLTGVLYRTGTSAGYTDTFDTASNLLLALQGNLQGPAIVPGLSFKLRYVNSVAQTATITLGAGMIAGSGVVSSVAASTWREFLFVFTSVQPPITNIANTVNGSAVVTWYLPPGQLAELQGPSLLALNVMPGASVSGTGIPANTTIIGVTQGQGGTLGFTMSANATGTAAVAVTVGPAISVSSHGSGTL